MVLNKFAAKTEKKTPYAQYTFCTVFKTKKSFLMPSF